MKTGKRAKHSIKFIPRSSIGWCKTYGSSFADIQQILDRQVFHAQLGPELHIHTFSDAGDLFWVRFVTQCNAGDLLKPVSVQKHWLLVFLSGAFNNTELGWTTFEKEGLAILQSFRLLGCRLSCETLIRVFIEHRNLLFLLCRTVLKFSLWHKVMKVQRWAV